jgi:hypothetical protein
MDDHFAQNRPTVLANRRFLEHRANLQGHSREFIFNYIYQTNLWGSGESASGVGSEDQATQRLQIEIPRLLRNLDAGILLDIPCGDFGWLSHADLSGVQYIGADIVSELVVQNSARFASGHNNRRFLKLDLTNDPLPAADVVLCRDCLVHLPFEDIWGALHNIKKSGSVRLLTTTFTELQKNEDIMTGDWRPLNLQKAPFHFPEPTAYIVEGCIEENGAFTDKSLGLWTINELPV